MHSNQKHFAIHVSHVSKTLTDYIILLIENIYFKSNEKNCDQY
jgi:hypothetical protein